MSQEDNKESSALDRVLAMNSSSSGQLHLSSSLDRIVNMNIDTNGNTRRIRGDATRPIMEHLLLRPIEKSLQDEQQTRPMKFSMQKENDHDES